MSKLKEKIAKILALVKERWNTPGKGRFINIKEFLSLAGSSLGVSMIVSILTTCLTVNRIAGIYQIDIISATIICLISSILGFVLQPLFGKFLQNTNTKIGRYKPVILAIVPVIAAFGVAATWVPQIQSKTGLLVYCYLICVPTLILYNLLNNTFFMMPAVITPNQQERTDIWSPIGLVIGFAPSIINLAMGWVSIPFINMGKEYLATRIMGIVFVVCGALMVLLILRVKERIVQTNENNEKVGLFNGLKMMLKNKPLMILTLALALGCVKAAVEADAEIIGRLRYASDYAKAGAIFSTLTMITGFAVTPNMIILPFLTRKFNNKTIMVGWGILNTVGYLVLGIIGVQNIDQGLVSAATITALRFISLFNAYGTLQPLMLSEIYDYQQMISGKRLEGYIQMFAYCFVLICTNLGLLLLAVVKTKMGYQPANYMNLAEGAIVSEELRSIANNYFNVAFIVSAVSAALFALVMLVYPLTKKKHAEIIEKLKGISAAEHDGQVVLTEDVVTDGAPADAVSTVEPTTDDSSSEQNDN